MTSTNASIRIDVFANFAEFTKSFDKGTKDLKKFQREFAKVGEDLAQVGSRLSLGVTAPFLLLTRNFTKNSTEMQAEVKQLNDSFNQFSDDLGRELLPLFREVVHVAKDVADGFSKLSPESKKTIATVFAFTAALGPVLVVGGSLVKMFAVATKGLGLLSGALRFTVGATNAAAVGFAEGGVAAGVFGAKATDTASRVGTLVGKLGFLAGGLLALGPAAHAGGSALGNLFFDVNKESDEFLKVLYATPKLFGGYGGRAEDAAKAVALFRLEEGKFVSQSKDVQEAINRQRAEYDALALSLKNVGPAAGGAFGMLVAGLTKLPEATVAAQNYLGLSEEFLKQQQYLKDHEADIRRLQEAFDPVGQALKRYNEQLEIARRTGLDLSAANTVLAREFYEAGKGALGFLSKVEKLSPALRDAVKEIRALDLGKPIENSLDLTGDNMDDFFKDLADQAGIFGEQFRKDMEAQDKALEAGLKERQRTVREVSDAIGDAAAGTKSWDDAFKDLISNMARTRIIQPFIDSIADSLFGKPGAGAESPFSIGNIVSGIGSIFGGARANGGPVEAGRSYVVGERSMEIFTPNQSGRISNATRGAGGVNIYVTTPDADSFRRGERQIARAQRRALGIG